MTRNSGKRETAFAELKLPTGAKAIVELAADGRTVLSIISADCSLSVQTAQKAVDVFWAEQAGLPPVGRRINP